MVKIIRYKKEVFVSSSSSPYQSATSDQQIPPVVIGTPRSSGATKVLLLGSGELGKEITIALQRFGVEVHAVDRYEGAPAHHVASVRYAVDMTDPAAIRSLVNKVQPDYVVPEIEALATEELLHIEEEGLATVIPTARAVHLTMNREGIRNLASEELGLPTSAYAYASTWEEYQEAVRNLGLPCVVKPVMSSSGKGQSVIRQESDIRSAWDYALSGGRVKNGRVIVERFVDFDYEITMLTIRSIDPRTGQPALWFCEPIGHRQKEGDYVESWQPATMSTVALENARSVAARITNALGGRGVFGVELFIKGDDVYFSEVSPRPHDTGLVTMASQRFSECDLHARAILGLPIDTTMISPGASAVIYGGSEINPELNPHEPVEYRGLDQALAVPESDVRLFGKPVTGHRRRMGVAVATAETVMEARERAHRAASSIKVLPSNSAE